MKPKALLAFKEMPSQSDVELIQELYGAYADQLDGDVDAISGDDCTTSHVNKAWRDNPEIPVIMFGEQTYKSFFGALPDKYGNLLGTSRWVNGRRYVLAYMPHEVLAQADLRWADWIVQLVHPILYPVFPEPLADIQVVIVDNEHQDRLAQLEIECEERWETGWPCALDIETAGFSPFEDEILCIAIAVSPYKSYVVTPEIWQRNERARKWFRGFLERGDWVLHNGKFDARFILQQLSVKVPIQHDTMLMHYILDERIGTHGLKLLCSTRLALPDYESELHKHLKRKSDSYRTIPSAVLFKYAGQDVCFSTRLFHRLVTEMNDSQWKEGLWQAYEFLIEATNGFVEIENNGMYVDRETLHEVQAELEDQVDFFREELARLAAAKGFDGEFNPNSFRHVQTVMYDLMGLEQVQLFRNHKDRSTSREAVDKLLQLHPQNRFLLALVSYREAKKILSTYVLPIEKAIAPDGRLRTDLRLHGTVTGRLASSSPNMQNIPRPTKSEAARMIRNMFQAEPGNILVGADYSQAELRVVATYAKEESMKSVWDSGTDLHTVTTEQIFGAKDQYEPAKWAEFRMIAKMLNFGLVYGRTANSIAVERGISKSEAHVIMQRFFAAKPALGNWLEEIRETAVTRGWLTTPVGRVRRFGHVTRDGEWRVRTQAANFPVQSAASDITLRAALDLHYFLKETGLGRVLLLVHDSIYAECRKEDAPLVMRAMERCMREAAPKILQESYVNFDVDVHTAQQWGEL